MLRRQSAQCVKKTGCNNSVWVLEPQSQTKYTGQGRVGGNKIPRRVVYCWCDCMLDSNQMCDCARVAAAGNGENGSRTAMAREESSWCWGEISVGSPRQGCASRGWIDPELARARVNKGNLLEVTWQSADGNLRRDLSETPQLFGSAAARSCSVKGAQRWRCPEGCGGHGESLIRVNLHLCLAQRIVAQNCSSPPTRENQQ